MATPTAEDYPLIIVPNELSFPPPYSSSPANTVRLTNPTNRHIIFKIKTTVPKRYVVRPNTKLVLPSETVEVHITLNPKELLPGEKPKDKFQVQSAFIDAIAPGADLKEMWSRVSENGVMKQRIKCNFGGSSKYPSQPTFIPTLHNAVEISETDYSTSNESIRSPSLEEVPTRLSYHHELQRQHEESPIIHIAHGEREHNVPSSDVSGERIMKLSTDLQTANSEIQNLRKELERLNFQVNQERENNARQRKTLETKREEPTRRETEMTRHEPSVRISHSPVIAGQNALNGFTLLIFLLGLILGFLLRFIF
ncbi:vesicle-associated membrane protein-associated protein A-like [Planoprotostelium fungivorum]|uniref:Vesicle-associated membrane protein-associated protein A-like n=1 Tax=Planoprotostelium fungivorum TaxID=1890364 RepID=A0A2P6NNB1_9EUKA|nr:vesicle-associated membrane protein-associated protein A-like [Planoprotostelium fungivorum]